MIASLRGTVAEKIGNQVVIDCGGVGYGVLVTAVDHNILNGPVKLYIYENIKEDSYELFGFTSIESKQLFEQLLSVKNVGPKVAMSVLDIGSSDEIRQAIASGNVKRLQTAKGVGKRAAEQMVVELRDKIGALVSMGAEDIVTRGGINVNDEAAQGLISLGYSETDAALALKNIDKNLPAEERIKLALKG